MLKFTGKSAVEISDHIRALVQNGDLKPHDALPPVRDLAAVLNVNRNTVAAAYQRLAKAGIAVTQGRLGTTICEPPRAGAQEGRSGDTALIDLADGNPNPDWLPDIATVLPASLPRPYLYGDATLLPEARDVGEKWFSGDCPSEWEMELTHGAVDAIERLTAAHLVAGDKVAVEDPCFLGTINALRLAGMQTVGVSVDESGMVPESLLAALESGARAVLLTPRAHNPTGASLTKRRADALKRILSAYPNVLVVIDDHFALLAETPYFSVIPASSTRWALVRSVSKGLGPDLRVAFVACDGDSAQRLRTRLAPGMSWVSHILQAIVASLMRSADVRSRLDAARDDYANRRSALHDALTHQGITITQPAGGFNIWIPVPGDARDIAYALAKKGWLVRTSNTFDVQEQSQAIRVSASKLSAQDAQRFAQDLKACFA